MYFRRILLAAALFTAWSASTAALQQGTSAGSGRENSSSLVDAQAKAHLRSAFREAIDRGLVAGGSLLVIERGRPVFNESFGHADLDAERPFGTEEVVTMASVSKPYTATVLMRLVEAGHLELDVPITNYLPEAASLRLHATGEAVGTPTLRQLLSHTGGFLALAAGDDWQRLVYGPSTMEGAVTAIIEAGLDYKPGTAYAYTQLGYVLAAHAAERVLGMPFEEICRRWLNEPLGLEVATFHPSRETLSSMPTRYSLRGGALQPLQERRFRAVGEPIDPAANLAATPSDIARLFLLHLNRGSAGGQRLLSEESMREMQTPQVGTPGYGLGLNVTLDPATKRVVSVRHGGATGTLGWADFENDIVGVLFTQTRWRSTPKWRALIYRALDEAGLGRAARSQRRSASG